MLRKWIPALLQFATYGAVGLTSNALGYGAYLLITYLGVGHKASMTTVFFGIVSLSYFGNRSITFSFDGNKITPYLKYFSAYLGCYAFNLGAMLILVDIYGRPHQLVQLALIFIDAPALFLLQRYWVFRAT